MRPRTCSALPSVLAALVLAAGSALADPPAGARAGLDAMSRGDNEAAVRLFTQFLLYGAPARPDRELAYVKRAEAFLALGRNGDALADARRAVALDPRNAEAIEVRGKAQAMAAAPPAVRPAPATVGDPSDALNAKVKAGLDAVGARNRAAFADYQARMAVYEAAKVAIETDKKAADNAYAASLAAHQAQIEALDHRRAADMADWETRVKACEAGDRSQCAKPAPEEASPRY